MWPPRAPVIHSITEDVAHYCWSHSRCWVSRVIEEFPPAGWGGVGNDASSGETAASPPVRSAQLVAYLGGVLPGRTVLRSNHGRGACDQRPERVPARSVTAKQPPRRFTAVWQHEYVGSLLPHLPPRIQICSGG